MITTRRDFIKFTLGSIFIADAVSLFSTENQSGRQTSLALAKELGFEGVHENKSPFITVAGVGGGGINIVNSTYQQVFDNINYVICSTGAKELEKSPVPLKIRLGKKAQYVSNNPQAGRELAEASIDEIRAMLKNNAKIAFIAACMGGGTGTGAAPVFARVAKELGIATVAVVTMPFSFEGQQRINQAYEGINELKAQADFLVVIDNEKLRKLYGELKIAEAFSKANNVLIMAVKSIAEQIDIQGKNHAREAVETAINSLRLEYKNILM